LHELQNNHTVRCPFCLDGEWFINREFKEPYGYPYRSQTIPCEVCNGSKAILKSIVKLHPDKEQITEKEREKMLAQLTSRRNE